MSTTIEDRLVLLLKEDGEPYGYWQALEKRTGIAAARWRKAHTRQQRPTTDMLAAICKLKPHYAFWLATGITDSANGHTAPLTALTFPERLYEASSLDRMYFQESIALSDKLYELGGIDPENEKQRMFAAERTMPLAHWVASPLLKIAYRISESEDYKALKKLWDEREIERTELIKKIKDESTKVQGTDKKLTAHKILGVDQRTAHQNFSELFFREKKEN